MFYPRQGDWSEADYLALEARSNQLVELTDGCLEVHAMPTFMHQLILQFLFKVFDRFVREGQLGQVVVAPLPVRVGTGKFREPDIAFFRPERIEDLRKPPNGADLVVEVVSEGDKNRERDLVTKREDYALAGIPEYWIVDPEEKRITVLTLQGQGYREYGTFAPGGTASSILLSGFTVAVDAVFAAGEGK